MRSGELFAGVGGLGMAVDEVFDAEPEWFAEFDEAPSKVLAHHHPDVPNLGDVTRVDFTTLPHTHVRAGGFPCQDVSLAGRRLGLAGGKRSGLWSEFARSIAEDRPEWVVIENVRGLLSAEGEPWHDGLVDAHAEMQRLARLVATAEEFATGNPARRREGKSAYARRWKWAAVRIARQHDRAVARFNAERRLVQRAIAIVLRDLADLGFDAEWTGLRASDVGAPHARFRVFILAWPRERTPQNAGSGRGRRGTATPGRGSGTGADAPTHGADPRADGAPEGASLTLLPTPSAGLHNDGESAESWEARRQRVKATGVNGNGMGMPLPIAVQLLPTPDAYSGSRGGSQHPGKRRDGGHTVSLADVTEHALLPAPTVGNATGGNAQRGGDRANEKLLPGLACEHATDWGPYEDAIRRWEAVIGRPAPAPVRYDGKGGKPRLNPELTEWMMGWPAGHVTDPEIGLTRPEQLKACGNGVVTQQAVAGLREMLARPGVPPIQGTPARDVEHDNLERRCTECGAVLS